MASTLLRCSRRSLAGALVTLLAGCGGEGVGGSGLLTPAADGDPAHLRVQGTPRQQGLWQGRLLKDEILSFHEAFQKAALAPDGDLLSPATKQRRSALLRLLEPARERLPEAARQELEGLSEGCGLPQSTLLLSELLTDLLRFGSDEALRLSGRLGQPAPGALALSLDGPLAPVVAPRLLWITRMDEKGGLLPSVTVLAWPGSLGGLLATRSDGLTLAAVECALEAGRQGLAGVPFDLSLRLAVEHAPDARAALALLAQTTAHRVAAQGPAGGAALEALCALAGDDPQPFAPDAPEEASTTFGVAWSAGTAYLTWQRGTDPRHTKPVP